MDAPERDDVVLLHPAVATTGRVMFALIFLLSGVAHFTAYREAGSPRTGS